MKRQKILCVVAGILALLLLGGCAVPSAPSPSNEPLSPSSGIERETLHIYGIVGPSGVGLVPMKHASETGETSLNYEIRFVTSPDEIVAKISTGEADIAAVPTNLAANLYQKKSGGVRMVALNTRGALAILENGNSIGSVADLRGKTIYAMGQGSNPEYILRHLLTKNGLDPERDVTLRFVAENEELAALLVRGTATVALVPEPLATTVQSKNPLLRQALSVSEEWAKLENGETPMMGCLMVRTDYAKEHPQAIRLFLEDYARSTEQATQEVEQTAALCAQYGVIASAPLAVQAIPRCQLTCVVGAAMRPAVERYFEVLFGGNPAALGGALPDEGFYYAEG